MMMMVQVKTTTREVTGKETDRHPRSLNKRQLSEVRCGK
jgi:hypothetical protein